MSDSDPPTNLAEATWKMVARLHNEMVPALQVQAVVHRERLESHAERLEKLEERAEDATRKRIERWDGAFWKVGLAVVSVLLGAGVVQFIHATMAGK